MLYKYGKRIHKFGRHFWTYFIFISQSTLLFHERVFMEQLSNYTTGNFHNLVVVSAQIFL